MRMTRYARIPSIGWIVLGLLLFALPGAAHAYIDPTVGLLLLQMLLGGVAAVAWLIKSYWAKVRTFFRRKKSDPFSPPER
ncbi:MAG TPA: hypothetical protein VJT81_18905 [Burkholderiales bacterium]|nr:hypothetical protein [Burkholderiales bacterium]